MRRRGLTHQLEIEPLGASVSEPSGFGLAEVAQTAWFARRDQPLLARSGAPLAVRTILVIGSHRTSANQAVCATAGSDLAWNRTG